MSVAQFVILESEIADFNIEMDGSALGASGVKLDKVAKEIGVTPLIEFFSPNVQEVLGLLEDAGVPLDQYPSPLPEEKWFAPSSGLASVRALADWVRESRGTIRGKQGVLQDLGRMEEILMAADQRGIRWHLGLDI